MKTMVFNGFPMFPIDMAPLTPQELLVGGGAPNRDVFVPQVLLWLGLPSGLTELLLGKHGIRKLEARMGYDE